MILLGTTLLAASVAQASERLDLSDPSFGGTPLVAATADENLAGDASGADRRATEWCRYLGFDGAEFYNTQEMHPGEAMALNDGLIAPSRYSGRTQSHGTGFATYYPDSFSWISCVRSSTTETHGRGDDLAVLLVRAGRAVRLNLTDERYGGAPFLAVTSLEASKGEEAASALGRNAELCAFFGWGPPVGYQLDWGHGRETWRVQREAATPRLVKRYESGMTVPVDGGFQSFNVGVFASAYCGPAKP